MLRWSGGCKGGRRLGYAARVTALALVLALLGAAHAGALRVDVEGDVMRSVELACLDGFRERQPLAPPTPGAPLRAVFSEGEHDRCTLHFKGASPARWGPVPADTPALACFVSGTNARCAAPQSLRPSARPSAPAPAASTPAGAAPATPVAPAPTGPPAPAPVPAGTPGAVRVTLADAPGVYGFEMNCRSGFRARADRAGRFSGVPDEECRIQFRGSPPAIVHRVSPRTHLDCHLEGVTAVCSTTPLAP